MSSTTTNGSNVSYIPHEKQVDTKLILSSINSLRDTITGFYHSTKNDYNVICLTNSRGEHSEVSYHWDSDIDEILEKVIGLLVSSGFHQETVESAICEKAHMVQMDSETNQ